MGKNMGRLNFCSIMQISNFNLIASITLDDYSQTEYALLLLKKTTKKTMQMR